MFLTLIVFVVFVLCMTLYVPWRMFQYVASFIVSIEQDQGTFS